MALASEASDVRRNEGEKEMPALALVLCWCWCWYERRGGYVTGGGGGRQALKRATNRLRQAGRVSPFRCDASRGQPGWSKRREQEDGRMQAGSSCALKTQAHCCHWLFGFSL